MRTAASGCPVEQNPAAFRPPHPSVYTTFAMRLPFRFVALRKFINTPTHAVGRVLTEVLEPSRPTEKSASPSNERTPQ